MNIIIKTTNHEVPLAMRELVEGKFNMLEKFAQGATLTCEIDESIAVERAGAKYHAEGNLLVNGKLYRAQAEHLTLEGAVDRVRDDLVRELRNASGKKQGLMRRGGAALKRMLRFGR
jgi:ribosomal subunit interface protein